MGRLTNKAVRLVQDATELIIDGRRRPAGKHGLPLQTGALPWRRSPRDESLQFLLVTSRSTNRWIVPKGWPMVGKRLWEAAKQEALEEAGAVGQISKTKIGSFKHEKSHVVLGTLTCSIVLYPLEVTELLSVWAEEAERDRKWFSEAGAIEAVSSTGLKKLIRRFAEKN